MDPVARLQEPVRRWLDSGHFPAAQQAFKCLEEADDSLQFLVLFRFLIIPIWMKNYAPATLRIPVWKILAAAFPHTIWISFLYSALGASLQDAEDLLTHGSEFKLSDLKWQHTLLFISAAVASLLISLYSYRKYSEATSEERTHLLRKEP